MDVFISRYDFSINVLKCQIYPWSNKESTDVIICIIISLELDVNSDNSAI